MAKRKRLSPANPDMFGAAPETKSAVSRAPIADVASDAATAAALSDLSQEMRNAQDEGRMVLSLPITAINMDHIIRDRFKADDAEMEALLTSIATRGQQTPIDVLEIAPGQYGLISGWRRCQAIARLAEDGQHDGQVLALLRRPSEASETYLSMVEENEIRVGLSYFERARIAMKSVEQGVFETEKAALLSLFRTASRPKRSKIRSFLPLVTAFDGVLNFPYLIGERLGLRLSAALEKTPEFAAHVQDAISKAAPATGEAEQALLVKLVGAVEKQSLKSGLETNKKPASSENPALRQQSIRPGLQAQWVDGDAVLRLSGPDVTPAFRKALLDWLRDAPKTS
ncbi:ParB/RepB/Spo0J family partition protein [Roseovarius sp. 2305UL8-3]|uniref:ParB/RepB/Spo0J family partition protein n=1 Tax=Roseovarius conchicola TaxID=3121636 RepID=UPI003529561B